MPFPRSPSSRVEPLKEGSGPERSKPAPGQVAAAGRLDRPPQRSERAGRDCGALSFEEGQTGISTATVGRVRNGSGNSLPMRNSTGSNSLVPGLNDRERQL